MTESSGYGEWFERNRHRLSGAGMALDGGEPGRADPAGFETAEIRILIARLSTYPVVLPSITHRMLLWAAQQVSGVYADLAFFPSFADAGLMRKSDIPLWLANGCKQAPAEFDVVAVSICTQQEALNLPAAMAYSGLGISHEERMAAPSHPLVILGGHAAGSVPFIHGDARPGGGGLVDAVCLGDGITWLADFLKLAGAAKRAGEPKARFLARLAKALPGTYVPSLYRHDSGKGAITAKDPSAPLPVRHRVDTPESWIGGYDGAFIPFAETDTEETLPLSFGCAYRCRFCQTGWVRGKLTVSESAAFEKAAFRLKARMAASDLNLLTSDASSIPAVVELVERLSGHFSHVSVKSLSVAGMKTLGASAFRLQGLDKREFTFGVEGISHRMRCFLGKAVEAGALVELIAGLTKQGLRRVKLFFIATGWEETSDVEEFEKLVDSVRNKASDGRLIASFMPLFHAPFTPLQFAEIKEVGPDLEQALKLAARRAGAEFRWSATPREIRLMNLLCRAGRNATPLLVRWSLEKGARYYDEIPPQTLAAAERMLSVEGLDPVRLFATQDKAALLPWDDLECGASKAVLWKSYRGAIQFAADPSPPARNPPARATPFRKQSAASHGVQPPPDRASFWVHLDPPDAFRPDATVARGLLRKWFAAQPEAVRAYASQPGLVRLHGASGLAILHAHFAAGFVPAKALQGEDILCCPDAVDQAALLFYACIMNEPDRCMAADLLDLLKSSGVPFQTVRWEKGRAHIVGKSFRKKAGLWGIFEKNNAVFVLCNSDFPAFAQSGALPRVWAARTLAIYRRWPEKCARCGVGERIALMKEAQPVPDIVCPDCCLLKP